tara:strand:+ start:478 stop:696 length:219 start_codon:yes stop_codon:yes gene_type:complete
MMRILRKRSDVPLSYRSSKRKVRGAFVQCRAMRVYLYMLIPAIAFEPFFKKAEKTKAYLEYAHVPNLAQLLL